MTISSWSQRITEAMVSLGEEFSSNELAYLALTSKIERPIRDKLAYFLHRSFENHNNIDVAREWRRVDLAVIVDRKPHILLESKAIYVFDIWDQETEWFVNDEKNSIKKDLEKLKNLPSGTDAEKLLLVLATDCDRPPKASLDRIVKYGDLLRKYHKGKKTEDETRMQAKKRFGDFKYFSSGIISGGHAFDIKVDVHWWIFGPY